MCDAPNSGGHFCTFFLKFWKCVHEQCLCIVSMNSDPTVHSHRSVARTPRHQSPTPYRDTRTLSQHGVEQTLSHALYALLPTLGVHSVVILPNQLVHVTTPKTVSQYQVAKPCRNTESSIVTQGEPSLSRQGTLCLNRAPKEACRDKPSQVRPRTQVPDRVRTPQSLLSRHHGSVATQG